MVGVGFGGLVLPEQRDIDFTAAIANKLVISIYRRGFTAGFVNFYAGIVGDCADRVAD